MVSSLVLFSITDAVLRQFAGWEVDYNDFAEKPVVSQQAPPHVDHGELFFVSLAEVIF